MNFHIVRVSRVYMELAIIHKFYHELAPIHSHDNSNRPQNCRQQIVHYSRNFEIRIHAMEMLTPERPPSLPRSMSVTDDQRWCFQVFFNSLDQTYNRGRDGFHAII